MNMSYSNKDLVEKAIFSLEKDFKHDKRTQRVFLQEFLLPVYQISNDEIRSVFISYFDKLRIDNWKSIRNQEELYEEIFRELDFLQYGCEIKDKFIIFLKNWINNELSKEVYSSLEFLKVGGIERMLEFINFLVKEKKLEQFSEIYSMLQNKKQSFTNEI